MKPRDLAEPASVTSESFVKNLNLDPAARTKAFQLYNQLLVDKGVLVPLDPGNIVAQMNIGKMPLADQTEFNLISNLELKGKQAQLGVAANDGFATDGAITNNVATNGAITNSAITNSAITNKVPNSVVSDYGLTELQTMPSVNPSLMSPSFIDPSHSNPIVADQLLAGKSLAMNSGSEENSGPTIDKQSMESGFSLQSKENLQESSNLDDSSALNFLDENSNDSDETVVESGGLEIKSKHKETARVKANTNKETVPLNSFERREKLNASIDKMNDSFFMNLKEARGEGEQSKILPFEAPNAQPRSLVDEVQSWKQNEALALPEYQTGKSGMYSQSFEDQSSKGFDSEMDSSESGERDLKGKDSEFQSQVFGRLNSEWESNKLPNVKADLNTADLQMSNVDKIKNVQNLIENAKILSQKGGGEMQMKLTPEGLGEVQLKVTVANGKVDLELKSQNQEVKKMLESTLSELKSSLAQHSLSIDKVKVDVGTQDSTSSGDSFLKQFQMNDNREQARQFLGQCRDNNFSQRNNMLDLPGFKNYQSQRGDDLEPVRNQSVRPRNLERNKGQGLNLVA
jgi:flagellar hook-length control protein FliK